MRAAHPEIPWAQITGMRSKIVQDYKRVDFDEVWRAATEDVIELVALLARFVPPDPP